MEFPNISVADFLLNVGFEIVAAAILGLVGLMYGLTRGKAEVRSHIANKMVELGELAGQIAGDLLPRARPDDEDTQRTGFLFEYLLGEFTSLVEKHEESLSHIQTTDLEDFIAKCKAFKGLFEKDMRKNKGFWTAYKKLLLSLSKASKSLRRRGSGRKARIRKLHDFIGSGIAATSALPQVTKAELPERPSL